MWALSEKRRYGNMYEAETQFAIAPNENISMRVFDIWFDIGGLRNTK